MPNILTVVICSGNLLMFLVGWGHKTEHVSISLLI